MKSINRILTETVARKAIKEIMDSPERSSRKLVDMALNFAEGQYLREFLIKVQKLLSDENSPYYRMVIDAINHIDTERLITFGMNIGFNSVTVGSPRIREIEQAENFDIPWAIYADMKNYSTKNDFKKYDDLFTEGVKLGIFGWYISAENNLYDILDLISKHDECAFVLFVKASDIDEDILNYANGINNIMFAVEASESAGRACLILREHKMLYSVYLQYDGKDEALITSDEFILETQTLRPVFTVFSAKPNCNDEIKNRIYDYIVETRLNQKFLTIPWDAVYDTRYIDGKISDDVCSAGIDENGNLFRYVKDFEKTDLNVFELTLHDALKAALPKNSQ